MSDKLQIKVNDNGPLLVSGDIELVDGEGNAYTTKRIFSLCRCGHSQAKPYCDGTHKKVGFESKPRV
ncbi:CDGSH iron-sulfur domain-containing protein [Virgibacillus necropolis]|uniref:CDGSH iron-sulfur domain-containing protein n=1 Tax=Virgibacillus necropolis TaxID=163877 RepID=UPI00384B26E8